MTRLAQLGSKLLYFNCYCILLCMLQCSYILPIMLNTMLMGKPAPYLYQGVMITS